MKKSHFIGSESSLETKPYGGTSLNDPYLEFDYELNSRDPEHIMRSEISEEDFIQINKVAEQAAMLIVKLGNLNNKSRHFKDDLFDKAINKLSKQINSMIEFINVYEDL